MTQNAMFIAYEKRIADLERENQYLVDQLYPLLDALRDLPELPSPDVLLTLSHAADFSKDWKTGKRIQRELGLDVVPPKTECEEGAGWWHRVILRVAELEAALQRFAKIEIPPEADDGTWVAKTIYCNDQVTAHQVRQARKALGT
jgi:hypothetical protein